MRRPPKRKRENHPSNIVARPPARYPARTHDRRRAPPIAETSSSDSDSDSESHRGRDERARVRITREPARPSLKAPNHLDLSVTLTYV